MRQARVENTCNHCSTHWDLHVIVRGMPSCSRVSKRVESCPEFFATSYLEGLLHGFVGVTLSFYKKRLCYAMANALVFRLMSPGFASFVVGTFDPPSKSAACWS